MNLDKHDKEIDNFVPENNFVLVKPDKGQHHLKDDKIYAVDTSFDEVSHAARTGIVIAVPKKLFFHPTQFTGESMPWDTDMELQIGDEVTYHFLAGVTAEEKHHERTLYFKNEVYYLIKYDRIFTAKRKVTFNNALLSDHKIIFEQFGETLSVIICLNGFVLLEPLKDFKLERYKDLMEIPKKMDKYFGKVKYIGSLNRDYRDTHRPFHGPDQNNINIGDVVMMDMVCDIPLEYPLHSKLDKGNVYYRVQRRYILGILN
jgi:hypothetical protein